MDVPLFLYNLRNFEMYFLETTEEGIRRKIEKLE
jgi:hypothetical protein